MIRGATSTGRVSGKGARSWILRYERNGRERYMGLGSADDVTLEDAREAARQARLKIKEGTDPIDARRVERVAHEAEQPRLRARTKTFEQCARQYHEEHAPKWDSAKYTADWLSSMERHAFPALGALPVAAIDTPLVLSALKRKWSKMPPTASRVRGRIEEVLAYATAHHYRTGDNPASWDVLRHALPDPDKLAKVEHMEALPYREVRDLVAELRALHGVPARALEFAILTAARTSEMRLAVWPEMDLKNKIWNVPPERVKSRTEHRVPLCDRAIEILENLPREKNWVWVGSRRGAPLAVNAALRLLGRLRPEADYTVHGFRSTFRDWAAECTNFPRELAEKALAHVVGDETERATTQAACITAPSAS